MSSSNVQIPDSSPKFTNLQLELLRVYSHDISEEELIKVKDFLGKMFLNKLSDDVNKSIEGKSIGQEELEKWLNEKS